MNAKMKIYYDDFHLSTFQIIEKGEFKPSIKKGNDVQAAATKALGFVARKAAPRLAPVIGWIIFANDIYNMLVPEN